MHAKWLREVDNIMTVPLHEDNHDEQKKHIIIEDYFYERWTKSKKGQRKS